MAEAEGARAVILAVDDDPDLLALIAKVLSSEFEAKTAADGGDALAIAAAAPQPELILLDVELPGASGFEVCKLLKEDPATSRIPVIFLTGKTRPDDQLEGFDLGAVDYLTKPINPRLLLARVRSHLALASRQSQLEREVQERTAQLDDARAEVIRRLARAMEFHESAAAGNKVARVSQYARLIAQASGMKPEVVDLLQKAAPLYDIGKIGVPSEVLRNPGKLSAPELERVRRHPQLGAEIIGEHDDAVLALARQLALTHHERWDGSGYPKGLKGSEIPWPGRVMGIVDTFEAMTSTQFYRRQPFAPEDAAKTIREGFGTLFDPSLKDAFDKAFPIMVKVRDAYSDALSDLINLDFSPTRGAPEKPAPPRPSTPAPAKATAPGGAKPQAPAGPKPAGAKPAAAPAGRTPPKR